MNIVCLAGCDWTASWQPTQEIMTRLAEQGHRVLYVDPTGTRNLCWADWERVWHRLKAKWWRSYPQTAYSGYGLRETVVRIRHHALITLYHPLVLPFPFSTIATQLNALILSRYIRHWLQGQALDTLWLWFPSPLNARLVKQLSPRTSIYQIMSTITAVRTQRAMHDAHRVLVGRAHHIFINSHGLKKELPGWEHKTHLFRAGCDTTLFDPTNPKWIGGYSKERPSDLPTGKPIIGYIGTIHEWFDTDLWLALKNRLPQYHFVEITHRSHGVVPLYLAYFDVCTIPYTRTAYTETSFPAKLHEYLAMGKPVVATRLRELETYQEGTGVNLLLSSSIEEWIANINTALEWNHIYPAMAEYRRKVARQHDYAPMVERMLVLIEQQRPA